MLNVENEDSITKKDPRYQILSIGYPCDQCGYLGSDLRSLNQHIGHKHKAECRYSCDWCSYSTTQIDMVILHIKAYHDIERYAHTGAETTGEEEITEPVVKKEEIIEDDPYSDNNNLMEQDPLAVTEMIEYDNQIVYKDYLHDVLDSKIDIVNEFMV